MMLYDFVTFTKNMTSAQAAEMFGMAVRTVQDLRLKVRRGAKDYQLKNIDGSKNLKFLEWKLKQVNKQIAKVERQQLKQLRLDAIRRVREIVAEFDIDKNAVVAKGRGRPAKNSISSLWAA